MSTTAKVVLFALKMVTVDCATLGIYLVVRRMAGGELRRNFQVTDFIYKGVY
jgi:hypothetical protein